MTVNEFLAEVRKSKIWVWCRCIPGGARACVGCDIANAIQRALGLPGLAYLKAFEQHALKMDAAVPVLVALVDSLLMARERTGDDDFAVELLTADLQQLNEIVQRSMEQGQEKTQ
jgi:hypothetical protein